MGGPAYMSTNKPRLMLENIASMFQDVMNRKGDEVIY